MPDRSYADSLILVMKWENHDINVVEWTKIPKRPLLVNGD